jgi:hypothetical protein
MVAVQEVAQPLMAATAVQEVALAALLTILQTMGVLETHLVQVLHRVTTEAIELVL